MWWPYLNGGILVWVGGRYPSRHAESWSELVIEEIHQLRTVDRRIELYRGRDGVWPTVITCGCRSAVRATSHSPVELRLNYRRWLRTRHASCLMASIIFISAGPVQLVFVSAGSGAPPRAHASRAPPRARASRAPPRARASRAPPRARASRAPPRARASRAPPRARASRAPPRARASRAPPRASACASACSETAPSRACSSPAPSRACSSPAPSRACSSPAPSRACSSPAPSRACS